MVVESLETYVTCEPIVCYLYAKLGAKCEPIWLLNQMSAEMYATSEPVVC